MTTRALNAAHGIPTHPTVIEGPGGLPMIDVDNAHATARISLYGGQVLAYRPRGAAADLLFVSEQAFYQPGKAIRGGVRRVHVISYASPDALLAEIFTNEGTGTLVVADTTALSAAEQGSTT